MLLGALALAVVAVVSYAASRQAVEDADNGRRVATEPRSAASPLGAGAHDRQPLEPFEAPHTTLNVYTTLELAPSAETGPVESAPPRQRRAVSPPAPRQSRAARAPSALAKAAIDDNPY